jgi:hypothetical protein
MVPVLPYFVCLGGVLVNLFSWMHCLSWENQPPFFYAPKFASLSALRWLALALIGISALLYLLSAVSLPVAALALNACQSIVLIGVAALSCYSTWRRHTKKDLTNR